MQDEVTIIPPFQERRDWFDAYFTESNAGVPYAPDFGVRYTCPCCGYPTLDSRCGWEICDLCDWEDDGQDDPQSNAVWGGPNKSYSLAEARKNFERYGIMYSPDRDPSRFTAVEKRRYAAKQKVTQMFVAMMTAEGSDVQRIWQEADQRLDMSYYPPFLPG